jgi:diguanylate cyclase (GGDEF)-like protein
VQRIKSAARRSIIEGVSPINLTLLLALATCLLALLAVRRRTVSTQRDLRSLLATTSELRHLADHDALTGLPNRRRFEEELARHLAHVRRYGPEGAALVLDLDCFKPVNDTFGHAAGDRLLARVACVLRERLRATDVVARLGGDEFAILLPRVDAAGASAVARSLVDTVRAEALTADARGVTVSVGIIAFDERAPAVPEGILAAADIAMYDAKAAGGDGWAFYVEPRVTATGSRASAGARASRAPAGSHSPAVELT